MCENKTYRIVKESPPLIRLERLTTELIKKKEGKHLSSSENSLSHTRWNCKYHIVFIPKYRRKVIYGKLKRDMGTILRRLCEMKEVEIVEAHTCKDHIHKDTM